MLAKKSAVPDFKHESKISAKIGFCLLEHGRYADALDIFNDIRKTLDAREILTAEEKQQMSSLLTVTGAIYEETGLWNEAMTFYMKSLQICDQTGYRAGKARVLNNIGKLYFNRNDFTKAEELFKKAVEINRDLNIPKELFNNYNNLAGVYKSLHRPEKALEYALIAMNQLDLEKDFYDVAIVYSNIGNLYQDMGNRSVALSYYCQALSIQRKKSFSEAMVHTLLSITDLYSESGQPDSAKYYLGKAEKIAENQGNPSLSLVVLKALARYKYQSREYHMAAGYYRGIQRLSDSLEMLNSLSKIEQIQSVYEVISREKDNKILQQKVNLQELYIQRQRIFLIAAVVIFLLLAYLIFNLQRNRKKDRVKTELIASQAELVHNREKEIMAEKENNLKLELDYKNRQLTAYALHMARNNEFITKTNQQLRQILLEINPRDKNKSENIQQVLSNLQQYQSGNDWEEFRLYFEEVHQSFEKNLTDAFPGLSSNNIKMCALLRLGLSTKDIASITFRELRSVESSRNRLRKKLDLGPDVSIYTFLSQF